MNGNQMRKATFPATLGGCVHVAQQSSLAVSLADQDIVVVSSHQALINDLDLPRWPIMKPLPATRSVAYDMLYYRPHDPQSDSSRIRQAPTDFWQTSWPFLPCCSDRHLRNDGIRSSP